MKYYYLCTTRIITYFTVCISTYIVHSEGISQNHNKHLNNFKSLLKHHVFEIQNFENNKKLWEYFEKKIELLNLFENFKKNKFIFKTVLSILNLCILNLTFSMKFLIRKFF